MAGKNMDNSVDLYDSKNMSPQVAAQEIIKLQQDLLESKDKLEDIKSRGLWRRMTESSSKDLADALIAQNDTIGIFLTIIKSVVFANIHNTLWLGQIVDSLNDSKNLKGVRDKRYINFAKEFINSSINSTKYAVKKMDNIEEDLSTIQEELHRRASDLYAQSKILKTLEKNFEVKEKLDASQDEKIAQLSELQNEGQSKDIEQDEKINEIINVLKSKDEIDNYQTSEISSIKELLLNFGKIQENQNEAVAKHEDDLRILLNKYSKDRNVIRWISISALTISILLGTWEVFKIYVL